MTYGCVKCKVASEPYLLGTRHKHERQYHLHVNILVSTGDGSERHWDAAINVGTTDADDLLKYKLVFNYWHAIGNMLKAAAPGFTDLSATRSEPALDFLRSNLLYGTGPWRDSGVMDGSDYPEPVASLIRLLINARSANADVYLYGRLCAGAEYCIHDVHMNQGSTTAAYFNNGEENQDDRNAIWQDGALFVDFGQPELAAYFTVFTRQMVPTDDLGNPTDNSLAIRWSDEGRLVQYPSFEDLR